MGEKSICVETPSFSLKLKSFSPPFFVSALEVGKNIRRKKKISCLRSYHPGTPTVSDLCDLGRDTVLCLSFLSHTPEEKGHVLQGLYVIKEITDNKPLKVNSYSSGICCTWLLGYLEK